MICGINDGYSKKDIKKESGQDKSIYIDQKDTFFSNEKCRSNPFKSSIIKWFRLWGIPLSEDENGAGHLERSISQINWIPQRSTSFTSNVKKSCIAENNDFYDALGYFKPLIIVLAGVGMHDAMESKQLRDKTHSIIGDIQETRFVNGASYKNVAHTDFKKAFRSKVVRYEKSTIIAMPHPSARGLSDKYIIDSATRNSIACIFEKYQS